MVETPFGSFSFADEFSSNPMRQSTALPKVLVVDDERRIADTLAEILQMAGFHAVATYDGWTALETATWFRPDYLLSDVLMPRLNGVQLAIAIRKMHPAAKVLLFSGQAGISHILLEGQRQGFEFDILAKPIHPLKLIERLKEQ
ncbi:response regulator [Edaphobacter modestus]|uniref:Response regulator receiver domain-containing protein n=1 Tax=Edaphobacter modestus TaxID=388466 RepID=A0A4Q7YZC7_9BACT|nr:response regulator [Edaphobacter modestus]RZU42529.1 response regulator receiver domain-containing protein [Edaphobacter modestus]